ncbi:MAG: choice-of-anchor J domain-containing protein, partial [Candidatus Zixiibacteriota bacterium]
MTHPSRVTRYWIIGDYCRSGTGIVLALLLIAASSLFASAEPVAMQYTFEPPEIEPVILGGERFDRVIMKGVPNGGNAGQPALPAAGASILLPYGCEVVGIEIIPGEKIALGSGFYVEPVSLPIRLSSQPLKPEAPIPDAAIYGSDQPFPAALFKNIGTQSFRGYQILTLRLQPVQYVPATGELYYFTDFTVTVNTAESGKSSPLFRGLPEDENEVMAKVDNPELAYSYGVSGKHGAKAYDLLIITTPALAGAFEPLKDYHDTTGMPTEIHTTDDVGSSNPDDIRSYITDRYLNDGISYAIIGADDDIIPAKDLYVVTGVGYGHYTEYNMPSDVFFGCLDGPYNYDGDSYWGEPNDGEGGGDVDLVAEVFIGRCAAGNTTEVDRFVSKTIEYLTVSGTYLQKVLMVGEYLGFGGPAEYAAETLDELIDGSDAHGYTTVGIPSDIFDVDRLYERDWPGNDWPQSELTSRINAGVHILDHLGHGSEDYAMKLYNSDILALISNTELCLVYSQTCLAGHLDGTDCWAEYMNIKIDEGAFAVIMNARYGFGESYSTDGPSQRFNREFWDAVFNTSEGKPELGRANHDSKEDNLYRIGDDCMRWCYYELNLFGDPTVSIRGVTGISFEFPTGIPEIVPPNTPVSFEVVVNPAGEGVPVPGSGQLHYTIDDSPLQTVWMTETSPNHYTATLPEVGCFESLKFYVSAEEATNGRFYSPGPGNPNEIIVASEVITAFTDDFETDMGWTVSGGLWARGIPTGGGGQYGNPDPASGHNDPNVFGYNLNGDYENSMPERHLTSPPIDCSELSGARLKFWRWLGVEQPIYDHAYIRISTDGSGWTTVWENGGTISDAQWTEINLDISDYADGQATVYLRWTMGITDGAWQYCGWNIDEVEVIGYACYENRPYISTHSIPDWTVGQALSFQLEAFGGTGGHTWSDKFGDLAGTGLTLSPEGLLSGTPTSSGTITFTAIVHDEAFESDEELYSFTINDVVAIIPPALPDWTAGIAYVQELSCTGGTEPLVWTDKNGDLSATGLTLAEDGLLSGSPNAGPVSFTAAVSDYAGATDEHVCSFTINPAVSIDTDSLFDWTVGSSFSIMLSCTGGTGELIWADKNNDLYATGMVLRNDGTFWGIPDTVGAISFTATVTDQLNSTDEKELSITINPALIIQTASLGGWTVDMPYSSQLTATGGTGDKTWADKDNNL